MDGIIIGGCVVARPLQFQLGKFTTINGIIEKQDPGWDDIDEKTFFHRSVFCSDFSLSYMTTVDPLLLPHKNCASLDL